MTLANTNTNTNTNKLKYLIYNIIYFINQFKDMSQDDLNNDYINQLTLNFLISKTQLHKLNKLKQKDIVDPVPKHDKDKINKLFNKLLNDEIPDDLLEDVKVCFDAFVEKSIYYLEIHDKNEIFQNERNDELNDDINDDDELNDDLINDDDELNDDINDDDELNDDLNELVEEYRPHITQKSKYAKQNKASNGVDDIQKLPLDWFNKTRQTYKMNQIISRKREIIVDNPSSNSR